MSDALAASVENAIATMPVKSRQEAAAVTWLLTHTSVAERIAEALRREWTVTPRSGAQVEKDE